MKSVSVSVDGVGTVRLRFVRNDVVEASLSEYLTQRVWVRIARVWLHVLDCDHELGGI